MDHIQSPGEQNTPHNCEEHNAITLLNIQIRGMSTAEEDTSSYQLLAICPTMKLTNKNGEPFSVDTCQSFVKKESCQMNKCIDKEYVRDA